MAKRALSALRSLVRHNEPLDRVVVSRLARRRRHALVDDPAEQIATLS